jgi:hypothetical protein
MHLITNKYQLSALVGALIAVPAWGCEPEAVVENYA